MKVIKLGINCGRGIMAARQLPKLKTRVRFPSPAPKIKPTLCRFYFWFVDAEKNPTESPRDERVRKQVDFGSNAHQNRYGFPTGRMPRDSLRCSNTYKFVHHYIISPHQKSNRPCVGFFMFDLID